MGGKKEIYQYIRFFHGALQLFVCLFYWCLMALSAQTGYVSSPTPVPPYSNASKPRPREKCELRKCEWVFCEFKCEPACDWSDIFRPTRSLPGATAFAHRWNFLSRNNL